MRIFVISHGYPTPQSPQWGCFEKDQAEALAALGHEVVMISFDGRLRRPWNKIGISKHYANGVHAYEYALIPTPFWGKLTGGIRHNYSCWLLDKAYKRAVKDWGTPDILYSHFLNLTYKALYLKKKYHLPLVGVEHWSEINKPVLKEEVTKMGRQTYSHLDGLIAVSSSLQEKIKEHFGQESIVVHNTFSNEFFYQKKESTDMLRLITTGSLIPIKGQDVLISALAKTHFSDNQWQLTIIGEGEERQNLEQLIVDNKLEQNVLLVGRKCKEDIAKALQKSDVYIQPSRNENFSVAVLEALACGLPVVATICGGIQECINESNGRLFPVDDVDALAEILTDMAVNLSKYDRQAIADDCQRRFGTKVIAQQITRVLEDAIKKYKEI